MKTTIKGILGIAWLFAALIGHAQTNYIIQSPVAAADHTIKIGWNSETNAVFQVESADSLSDVGAQGLQWVIRDADWGSKGTNAEWMDVGDPQWLPRILHPRFQPQRFYRIKKIGQATGTKPTVTVQLSQGGTPLPSGTNIISGDLDVSVIVNLVDTNQVISAVKLIVDGQKVAITDFSFSTSINTCEWPNGIHEIYGVATTANENDLGETTPSSDTEADAVTNDVQVAIGVANSKFCVFSNYISQFFVSIPFFQVGQTQEVVAKFEEDSYWRVTVVDYQDSPVRQFDGRGSSAYAAWDGNDGSGNPLSYGYYDYIVDARPSRFGPLSISSSVSSQSAQTATSASVEPPPLSGYQLRAAPYKQTTAAMQFSRSNTIPENIAIPSLNPTNAPTGTNEGGGVPSPMMALSLAGYPTSVEEALSQGLTSYFIPPPPYPPIFTNINGNWITIPWEDVHGPIPPIEIQISESEQESYLMAAAGFASMDANGPEPMDWDDQNYETRTPTRTPGNLFFGFAGSVGVGYQGHHPRKKDVGAFANAPGGVLASAPPWGPLKTASSLANNFSVNMGYAGWRTSFLKGDDNLNSLDLNPVLGPGTGTGTFATQCHFGFLVGHMTASARNDPNYFATVPYYPVYNSAQPGAYQWIATPNMDLGNSAGSVFSKLKWMSFYGCQSFKERDYTDLWTKFLLPMPPNLRLILGAEDGVFIMPGFGTRFAGSLNGWTVPGGNPMSIWQAWCDAAADTDTKMSHSGWYKLGYPLGTRRMTCISRDNTQGGSWRTISDSIWGWQSDISYDWFDVSFTIQQVY
jgi:hypothetical protein